MDIAERKEEPTTKVPETIEEFKQQISLLREKLMPNPESVSSIYII